jgi:hypothetical protein
MSNKACIRTERTENALHSLNDYSKAAQQASIEYVKAVNAKQADDNETVSVDLRVLAEEIVYDRHDNEPRPVDTDELLDELGAVALDQLVGATAQPESKKESLLIWQSPDYRWS